MADSRFHALVGTTGGDGMKKIEKITKKFKIIGSGIIHDTRGDIRLVAIRVNELTDKVNELVDLVNMRKKED